MDPLLRTTAVAASNHGVIDRSTAVRAGLTARQIDRRVARSEWVKLHQGVYLIPPATLTFEARCAAALLAVGASSVLTGVSAGYLVGWLEREPDGPIEVVHHARARINGVRVFVDPELHRYPKITCAGLRISPLEVTTFFAARSCEEEQLHRLIQEARKRGLREQKVEQTVDRLGGRGSRGTANLRRRMAVTFGSAPTDSRLEDLFLPHLHRRFLQPALQAAIWVQGRYARRGDFVFFDEKIDAETDGRDAHSGERFDRDREIDRLLLSNGWLVPRYTWKDIRQDPRRSADHLASLVRSRQRHLF